MATEKDISQALVLCKKINYTSEKALKTYNVQEMKDLRDAARLMADHLDNTIVKETPCKYNRDTVLQSIDGFSHYNFKKHTGLCDHNLSPILDEQVAEAIRAEKGDVAIDMLIPLIDVFNQYPHLDDSSGSGSMFVSAWIKSLNDAVDVLEDDWNDDWKHDDLIEEVLESIDNISNDYGWDLEDLEDAKSILEGYHSGMADEQTKEKMKQLYKDRQEESYEDYQKRVAIHGKSAPKKMAPLRCAALKKEALARKKGMAVPKKKAVPKKRAPPRPKW